MNFQLLRNFNRHEKVALLQLFIKVAGSDNQITNKEQDLINQFLRFNNLKINQDMVSKALAMDTRKIAAVFTSKSNIDRGYKLLESFAEKNGIDPDFEGKALDEIQNALNDCKTKLKFSLTGFFRSIFSEFSYLWGKEDMNPAMRLKMALFFTLLACIFGSFYTTGGWFFAHKKTNWIPPKDIPVYCGLLIYGAMCCRKFLPLPNTFRNLLFCAGNIYLLSTISMHLLGVSPFEMTPTIMIFFALIILSWLGIRELLGFVLIGFFILLPVKLFLMNTHMGWRAYPFIFSAFIGIGFQSDNLFNDFTKISGSFFKNFQLEKDEVHESLELAGNRIKNTANKTVSTGAVAAKAYLGQI